MAKQGHNWHLQVGSWRQVGGSKVKEHCSWTPSHPLCWGVRWGLTAGRPNVGSGRRCTPAGGQRGGSEGDRGSLWSVLYKTGRQSWKEWCDVTIGACESTYRVSENGRQDVPNTSISIAEIGMGGVRMLLGWKRAVTVMLLMWGATRGGGLHGP